MFTKTKLFSHFQRSPLAIPNLIEVQRNSFDWFIKEGLQELFDEISPVKDYTGKDLELSVVGYYFDEPKFSEEETRERDLSFEAPLRVKMRLLNKRTKEIKEQEVYFGDIPMMTDRGTFIIHGVERVVVSQLIRSSGIYFNTKVFRGEKLFGAKIIPSRGVWIEFETDPDHSLIIKIDRKRKIAASALLRIFGLESNEAIEAAFKGVIDEKDIIKKTLAKDPSQNKVDAYVEIYKRVRPGDLATPENAQAFVDALFFRNDRYDLSPAGRFKMNSRLRIKGDDKLLTQGDLIAILKEIIRLNNDSEADQDDIDHLGNRRVKGVGELLQSRMRVGFARMRRVIQDKMSTNDIYLVTPTQLVVPRQLMAVVKEFFSSSQLSQFMDQVNPLAEIEHKRRISSMGPGGLTRERAGFEVRDVHTSHYGRLCPVQTPEGANVGLINYLATYARVREFGFIETPYLKVEKGVVTKEVVWLNAYEEEHHVIAHGGVPYDEHGKIIDKKVTARTKGQPALCMRDDVEYMDIASNQPFSVAASMIPFFEHDDANRTLMGANMQRQAVVYVRPEAPLVGTGIEEKVAEDSGYLIKAPYDGEIMEVDANHLVFKAEGKKDPILYKIHHFRRSNQFTSLSQRPVVKRGDKVKKGQVLVDGPGMQNGVLGLGQNLLVAFMTWGGGNYEDAILLSERVVQADRFSSIHIEEFDADVRETKLGPEITTPDIPNVSEDKLRNLDEEGIIRVGAEVSAGDILVGKVSPKGETDLTAEERLLRAIFGEKSRDVKDTSLTLPHGKRGRIVGVRIFSRERGDKLEPGIIKRIRVEVAVFRRVMAGDKLAGRHGNKGVISRIVPVEDMPYLADGTPVDIILNPLGVASRMNIGQILETHLGWAAQKNGYRAIVPIFSGTTEDDIREELKKAGLPEGGKIELHDGKSGKRFDHKVTVGYIYMLKLDHLVEDKLHMRSIGPYSLITQQPLGGKAQHGGQRFGEMEVWALEGYGTAHTLQEMITLKSDDVLGRSATYESIIYGEDIKTANIPASFNVLTSELKGLGFEVDLLSAEEVETGENRMGSSPSSARTSKRK
ncbi:MAG: DNA-directed RNA polymerase subunit beta [Patescibacteria group bacterium]|nr:DNA-directed RNA polymerase subunit beta [Patescibacteria group bacterium]MDE2438024.1 DNA-directed RNA polymerase subunit beta [Patescibacteria group bacterium]